jgi:heterodisulfide reductase subunit D
MIKAVFDNKLERYTERFIARMNQCLLCGNCSQNCPPGVEGDKIIEAARADYVKEKGLTDLLKTIKTNIEGNGNITGDEPSNRMLWMKNIENDLREIKINEPAEYVYFAGCVPTLYPSSYSIPQAFVRILKAGGVSFTLFGEEEKCCGYPLVVGGLPEEARKVAENNVRKLKGFGINKVVTTCPSCFHMWKSYYPELLGFEPEIEIVHSTQLLLELISKGEIKLKELSMEVTYHDPCDLGRKSGIFEPPREILRSIPGIILKEMKYNRQDARCCGGGGNLEMNDSKLSSKVAQNRVKQALDTGAELVVTACQQCKRTLQTGAREMKAKVKVKDICEIVFDALV